MSDLQQKKCAPCEGGTQPMTGQAVQDMLSQLADHWQAPQDQKLAADFKFKNYYRTQAFVNAVAYIAHREDHHPDISFGYNQCHVELTTHAIGGLSENDFIFASKVDWLINQA